jgi:hypothetical protein
VCLAKWNCSLSAKAMRLTSWRLSLPLIKAILKLWCQLIHPTSAFLMQANSSCQDNLAEKKPYSRSSKPTLQGIARVGYRDAPFVSKILVALTCGLINDEHLGILGTNQLMARSDGREVTTRIVDIDFLDIKRNRTSLAKTPR